MVDVKVYLTAEGRESLERELEELVTRLRPEIAQKIKEAVEDGDLKENANYHDAKEKQAFIEGRIADIEAKLRNAVLIEKQDGSDLVQLGSTVTIREVGGDEDEVYTIVGAAEAKPHEGRISNESPIGEALLGRRKNDKVRVITPDGHIEFKIRKVQ
jgi:transcription elongation factor GreA